MKKIGIVLFVSALTIGLIAANVFSLGRFSDKFTGFSINFGKIRGSGNVVTEKRDLSGFNAIDVGGVFKVEITTQKEFSVEVEADDNLLSQIKTEVRGDTLHIGTKGRVSSSSPMIIRISAPSIEDLDVSGVANVTLNGVKNEELKIDASGASKITVSGETAKLVVDVSGATKIVASELLTGSASIEGSGASSVDVNVSGELKSDLSGASRVEYSGSPTNIVTKKSGGSRVSAK